MSATNNNNRVFLTMQTEDTEQMLQIIERSVGYELNKAGIYNIRLIDESACKAEHDAAIAAINHHHDVLYQRGVNAGLKGVDQLGGGNLHQFEIEENKVLERAVVLVEVLAKISLHKEAGFRGGDAPGNLAVFGTSKKAEEGALVAALKEYWEALRKVAWDMVDAQNEAEAEESDAGKDASGGDKGRSDPEDLALSSEDDK